MNFTQISREIKYLMDKSSSLADEVDYTPGLSVEVLGRLRNIELAKQGLQLDEDYPFGMPGSPQEVLKEKKKLDYSQAFKAGLFLDKQKEIQKKLDTDKDSLYKTSVESQLKITYKNLKAAFSKLLNKKFNTDFCTIHTLIKGEDLHVKFNNKDKYITKSMTPLLYKQACYSAIQLMTLDVQPTQDTIFYVSYLFDYSTTFPREWELIARQIFQIIYKNIGDALDYLEFPKLIKKQYPKNDTSYLCFDIDLCKVTYGDQIVLLDEVCETKIGGVSIVRRDADVYHLPKLTKVDPAIKDKPINGAFLPDWDDQLELKLKNAAEINKDSNETSNSINLHSAMRSTGFNPSSDIWKNCYKQQHSDDSEDEEELNSEIEMLYAEKRKKIIDLIKKVKTTFEGERHTIRNTSAIEVKIQGAVKESRNSKEFNQ